MNPLPLKHKTALITGGARGIGYGIARRYADEGASVVLADINQTLAEESATRITDETDSRALALRCDVTDRANVDAVIAQTVQEFGSLDILVSNAGICPFVEFLVHHLAVHHLGSQQPGGLCGGEIGRTDADGSDGEGIRPA